MSEPAIDDDTALVAGCRAGEASAWVALVRRHQRLVFGIALRSGLDEHAAADVLQAVFTRLLAHLSRLSQPGRLHAWIVTTAKRESLRLGAIGRRTVSLTQPQPGEDDDSAVELVDGAVLTEDALSELQQLELLRRSLDRLSARCKELLLALFCGDGEGLTYDEVARRLGMPLGSLGPSRARCLVKLRKLIEESDKKT
jgi:RNA polymerase sigma factor (sigma-70 family)